VTVKIPERAEAFSGFGTGLLDRLGIYEAAPEERRYLCGGAILYTAADEDNESELEGLGEAAKGSVVSITGSGCRSLSLLVARPEELISVDANPLQNYLLELKATSLLRLEHPETLAFLGVGEDPDRWRTYRTALRDSLSPGAREFWDLNQRAIERGVLYTGAHETHFRRTMRLVLAPRRSLVDELFSIERLEDQRRFYHERWNSWWWRLCIEQGIRPAFYRLTLPDPSYTAHVEIPGSSPGRYIHGRFEHTLTSHLARDNHVLSWMLLGRYSSTALPLYLRPEHHETIKQSLEAMRIETAPIGDFLAQIPDQAFDAYSLSDISGWTSVAEFDRILDHATRSARPGARFCYRNFFTKREIPPRLHDRVEPLDRVARELEQRDLSFAYTFQVGEVRS
jgi:S-adenosylmethionine-diacylglycerol 3-amino-3-carboxypropyl transferase